MLVPTQQADREVSCGADHVGPAEGRPQLSGVTSVILSGLARAVTVSLCLWDSSCTVLQCLGTFSLGSGCPARPGSQTEHEGRVSRAGLQKPLTEPA